MSSMQRILQKVAQSSGGKMELVKVPKERRLTQDGYEHLKTELSAQLQANRDMEFRSYICASERF